MGQIGASVCQLLNVPWDLFQTLAFYGSETTREEGDNIQESKPIGDWSQI